MIKVIVLREDNEHIGIFNDDEIRPMILMTPIDDKAGKRHWAVNRFTEDGPELIFQGLDESFHQILGAAVGEAIGVSWEPWKGKGQDDRT